MKRFTYLLPIIAFLAMVGCAITPNGTAPVVTDAFIVGNAEGFARIGLAAIPPADQVAGAQLGYEVALAINSAATNGVSQAAILALAQKYLGQADPTWGPAIGGFITLIMTDAALYSNTSVSTTAPSTQPSTGQFQEFLVDASQGVENACLSIPGVGTPSSTALSLEQGGSGGIVVKHFSWTPKP